ncbi:hypothetical protein OHS59_22745 [Streptomyces sp. NBC_00414]|uniref:hypothetical protein n=1 Tax=Streptomyces sp. NBC_00414 TaxID=2975739 RepID=UPI002E23C9D8
MSVAVVFTAVSPAQADSNNGRCDVGEACLYRYADSAGGHYDTLSSKKNYSGMVYYGTSVAVDNTVSSAFNYDVDSNLWFYQYNNWSGDYWGLTAITGTNFGSAFDNKPSSHCWSSTSGCPTG